MKKYWGDTICSECGKEIPYGVRRWCPKCNALDKPKVDIKELAEIIREADAECACFSESHIARAIVQKASEIITFGK